MARYCFYCGRELKTGERCSCSTAQQKRAEHASAETTMPKTDPTPSAAHATDHANAKQADKQQAKAAKKAEARARTQARANDRATKQATKTRIKQERASGKRQSYNRIQWQERLFAFGRSMVQAIRKPTSFIQDASHPSTQTAIVAQVFESILMTLVLIRVMLQSNIGNLIAYGSIEISRKLDGSLRWLFFFRIFLVAIMLLFIRIAICNLITRFVGRQPLKLVDTARLMTPGSIYFSFFLIIGLILSNGSGIQTMLLVMAGYGVKLMIDHFALRMETGLPEDRMIQITLLTFLCTALVFGSVIGALTPNLSDFRVNVPGDLA